MAADESIDGADVVEALAQLVAQSLVLGDTSGKTTRYRVLDTTRAYAHSKLAESGEEPAIARRHALYCLERLAGDREESPADPDEESAHRAEDLANVRAALEWSFSEAGDAGVGVKLAAASAQLSSISLCCASVANGPNARSPRSVPTWTARESKWRFAPRSATP